MQGDLKPVLIRQMEVYAGFLEYVDYHVGRLLDSLEAAGILDDTLVFYIIGDNGASAEGTLHAGNSHHDEIHGQYVAGFAAGIVGRRAIHGLHTAVRKSFGIETRRGLGVVVVPETDNIFVHYVCTFRPPAVTLPSEFFWIIGGIAARNFDGIAARWVAVTVV